MSLDVVRVAAAIAEKIKSKTDPLEARLRAVELQLSVLAARPEVRYRGVYVNGQTYPPGTFITKDGSVWYTGTATSAVPGDPSPASRAWRLAVKHGAAGKDAR